MAGKFLKNNEIVFIFSFFAVMLEILAQFFVCAIPFFTKFWIFFIFALIPLSILISIKNFKTQKNISIIFFGLQVLIVVALNFLYEANGATFQKEMLYQRNDAVGTLEQFNVNPYLFAISICLFLIYLFIVSMISKKNTKLNRNRMPQRGIKIWAAFFSIVCLCFFSIMPILDAMSQKRQTDYYYMLTSKGDGNQMYGSTANLFYELVEFAANSKINLDDLDALEDFIYAEPAATSKYNSVSKGNNLIVVLVESFDTHVLEKYSKAETALLFPNITRMMNEGIYGSNFRQKEKTDTSEVMQMLGVYPTDKYVNYNYEKNAYPFSLPNLFKANVMESGIIPQVSSFHQNDISFYNRKKLHSALGFDKAYGIKDMLSYGMINSWNSNKKERNLDSLTVETMKDIMFPKNKSFFTYWITFAMHGFYEKRDNLAKEGYYDKLDQYQLFPEGNNDENHLRTYAATVMDFDRALGIMLDDLEKKKILDKTTIVLVPDHNTYYNKLTEIAKNLNNKLDPEGFRLPFILYDQKLVKAFEKNGESTVIDKFITTTDLVPTIFDLFGINAWKNMYLGSTIFNNQTESIVYSRIYHFFFNDKVAFYTLDDLYYQANDFKEQDLEDFIARAHIHLDKLYYMDKIFYSDYFKNKTYRKI